MMIFLFFNNVLHRLYCCGIVSLQHLDLMFEMSKNHTLNSNRCCHDGLRAKEAGHHPQQVTA